MIMLLCHRLPARVPGRRAPPAGPSTAMLPALLAALALAATLAPAAAPAAITARGDGDAAVANAEDALNRGDCGLASRLFKDASQSLEQPELAARASSIALACGQYPIARAIAARWLQFAPGDTSALLALTQAELGDYRIADARRHFRSLIDTAGTNVTAALDAVVQRVGSEPALAMLRDMESPHLQGAEAQLSLAALALDGWDAN
ncbi:MAG: hypothetical protein KGL25_03480, partial [Gammaproteobacteria bacterium]|nr:hypothetical protein [Gammaproteobacteria bacterium]